MDAEEIDPKPKMTKADWRDLAAQKLVGDPGPLGIAKIKPVAKVSFAEIKQIVEGLDLGLENELQTFLIGALRKIMADYMGPLVYAAKQKDHARSIKLLDLISKESAVLAQHLSEIDRDFLVELDEWRKEHVLGRGDRYFNFLHLERSLQLLSEASRNVYEEIPRRKRGRSTQVDLQTSICRLRVALLKARLKIKATEAGGGRKEEDRRKKLDGPGGILLLELFRHFNCHITEATLVTCVKSTQATARQDRVRRWRRHQDRLAEAAKHIQE